MAVQLEGKKYIGGFFLQGLEVPSQNVWDRLHWGKRKRMKDSWWVVISCSARMHSLPPIAEGTKRTIIITHKRKRLLDQDNLWAASKSLIVDALKFKTRGFGLIYDDDPKHCEIDHVQERVFPGLVGVLVSVYE